MSTATCYCFDLDGTLIDSEDAVRKAYADVGAFMPDDAWGKPWTHWTSLSVHSAKNRRYVQRLADVPVLPPFVVAQEMIEAGETVGILTGASQEVVNAFVAIHRLFRMRTFGYELTKQRKFYVAAALSVDYDNIIVIDDDYYEAQSPHVRYVHYTGQSVEQLKEDIPWTQSS